MVTKKKRNVKKKKKNMNDQKKTPFEFDSGWLALLNRSQNRKYISMSK